MTNENAWQPSLFSDEEEVSIDESWSRLERIELESHSWLDYQAEWVSGAGKLFTELVQSKEWSQRSRQMYEKVVQEPRLTWGWNSRSGEPLEPPILESMRSALSQRYEIEFDSCGLNYYRDGRDSVAWHRDRIRKEVSDPIVVLISVGERRKFMYRPYGGGKSASIMLGAGDLLVTGGKFQREWEHAVPKVASAGPRISIAFRHGMYTIKYVDPLV